MKTREKQQRHSGVHAPLPTTLPNSPCLQQDHCAFSPPSGTLQWKTPLCLMSEDISVHMLNAHQNQGLVQTILAEHLHHIYLFQEAAYTKQLRCTQTLDPRFPLGVWHDGYPCKRGFLDFMHTNKQVCIYIDKNIDFLYAYEEVAKDIQVIHVQHKDNDRHAFSLINVYIDHDKTTITDIGTALQQCKHIYGGRFQYTLQPLG